MTVVAAYLYRHGKRVREIAIDEKIDCAQDKSEFVWIGIADPTERGAALAQEHYDLHPLAVEDALKADQLPKVDVYGDQLFVVARTAHLEGGEIAYGETAMFVGHSHIISVRHVSARTHRALREQLEAAPSPAHARRRLCPPRHPRLHRRRLSADGRGDRGGGAGDGARAIDNFLGRDEINRIFTLRRELIRFQRVLGPMGEVREQARAPGPALHRPRDPALFQRRARPCPPRPDAWSTACAKC